MGLNPRGRGRGRGGKGNFSGKNRRGGGMAGQGPMFRPGPPGMFCPPPMGFPPEPPFGGPFFGGPSGFNFGPPRGGFGKFPRKNFKRKPPVKSNDTSVPEIDLTKPWVTEEIKQEDAKKQECLETWRKTKDDEDWSKYKAQKMTVQTLYDKAKEEYIANHPDEAVLWQNVSTLRNYYCETCDKSFRTDDDLILHEAEHETCGRDGCDFTAHPKIIAKHIKVQHDSGLFKRIGKIYTEEDIAKWIEERKKRYPSRKVIEEKKILEQEKIERGEKIKDDDSKFNKSFQKKNNRNSKKSYEKRNKLKKREKKKKTSTVVQLYLEEEEASSCRTGVPAFTGIGSTCKSKLPEKTDDLDISDEDEWEAECCNKAESNAKVVLNNSLGLLAASYDSEEEIQNVESQKENKTEVSDDEGSGPEEVKTICSKEPQTEDGLEEKKVSHKRKLDKKEFPNNKRHNNFNENNSESRSLTLLEKLLKNEIRHERNVILQCVHYVVKNNFFKS